MSARTYQGQIVFADIAREKATLDCLLASDTDGVCRPVTLVLQLPTHPVQRRHAIEVLERWAEQTTPVLLRRPWSCSVWKPTAEVGLRSAPAENVADMRHRLARIVADVEDVEIRW